MAERLGIPAVVVTAPGFAEQARTTGYFNGVPDIQVAVYPGAFDSHSATQLTENTTTVVFPQIVDLLTKPIVQAKKRPAAPKPADIVFEGTVDEVSRYFSDQRWSDGMAVIPPTAEAVEEFLKYTDLAPDQEVAVLPAAYLKATPWNIAVNALMAGCRPEYMPILIAYVRAIGDPEAAGIFFGSTHSWIPYIWLNGPLGRQLGIDHGQGLIGHKANAAIGRTLGLIVMNLAGFRVKESRMGSFGYTVSWALAEDEEFCCTIGWKPYHVQQGFEINQNTLTASSSLMWGNNLIPATADPKIIMQLIAWEIVEKQRFSTGSGSAFTTRTLMITPPVARDLSRVYTKDTLEADLVKIARRTAYERAFANFYASPGGLPAPTFEENIPKIIRAEGGEAGGLPPWLPSFPGREEIVTVPVMKKGKTAILVCGDESRNKTQTLPGGSYVTREIPLPRNWDALAAELGYRPLKEYFLKL